MKERTQVLTPLQWVWNYYKLAAEDCHNLNNLQRTRFNPLGLI